MFLYLLIILEIESLIQNKRINSGFVYFSYTHHKCYINLSNHILYSKDQSGKNSRNQKENSFYIALLFNIKYDLISVIKNAESLE